MYFSDSQEANVPGTPVIQSTLHSFLTPITPVNLNRRPHHYETPLLEIVLLRSGNLHKFELSCKCYQQLLVCKHFVYAREITHIFKQQYNRVFKCDYSTLFIVL